jgi:hypothetical protein
MEGADDTTSLEKINSRTMPTKEEDNKMTLLLFVPTSKLTRAAAAAIPATPRA